MSTGIEELIGWERRRQINYADGQWVEWWQPPNPPTPDGYYGRDVTIDDMLEWLRGRMPGLMLDGNWHGGGYELTVHDLHDVSRGVFGAHQPTMLEAFADVVKQVALAS